MVSFLLCRNEQEVDALKIRNAGQTYFFKWPLDINLILVIACTNLPPL